jgi:hypothetical protein
VGCPSSIDLGTNTIISPTIPINTSNPNPHNTVIGFLANLAWEEAAQSSLTTPLLSGHTYQVQIWAYNVRGTWDGTSPPQSINTGPTTFAPYFTIGSSSSTLPSPPPLSFYPTSAVNVLNTFTLTGANNTWQQYTATFTHSATTHSNLLIGLDYGKNFASGYLTNNQLYAVIDEISIKDITPLAVIGNTICSGTTGTLTALGASSYTWQPGSIVSPTITTTTAGVYTVTGSYAAGQTCTVGPVASTVTILPSPTVNITASSQTICAGNIVTLTANGTGLQFQYLWTPYQTYYVTNTISVTPTVTTTYTVLAHGTAAGNCPATSTITIYVVPASTPTINITATPTLICGAGSTTLTASGAITYTWNPGAISGASVSVTPTATTVYTVQGSACGFTSTKTITITVAPNPTITVNSATICAGNSATLTANGGTTYYWAPSVVTPSIVVSPTVTTGYMVLGFDSNGCPGTAVSTVYVTRSFYNQYTSVTNYC